MGQGLRIRMEGFPSQRPCTPVPLFILPFLGPKSGARNSAALLVNFSEGIEDLQWDPESCASNLPAADCHPLLYVEWNEEKYRLLWHSKKL